MTYSKRTLSELFYIGRYYAKIGKSWGPTLGAWSAGLGVTFLFFTDWKVITQKIPFIKSKYDHEIPK